MTYKKKKYFLIALIAVLVLLYAGNLIFNSDLVNRQRSFAWLDSNTAERITKINIISQGNEFELFLQDNLWHVLYENNVYPARQLRVLDFLNALTTRSAWQVRSSNASTHERFGLLAPPEISDKYPTDKYPTDEYPMLLAAIKVQNAHESKRLRNVPAMWSGMSKH